MNIRKYIKTIFEGFSTAAGKPSKSLPADPENIEKFFALRVTPPAHPVQARAPKWPKIAPTWHQNGSKMEPTWSQLGTKMEQHGAKMGQTFEKIGSKKQRNKKSGGLPQRRSILAEKVANMAPSWAPK